MTATAENIKVFAPLKWATPFLTAPDCIVRDRYRGRTPTIDRFCRGAMKADDGMQRWVELYQEPTPGSTVAFTTLSLCKYGPGLTGYSGICHGGAVMTMMDEALGWAMVVQEALAAGKNPKEWLDLDDGTAFKKMQEEGVPVEKALRGWLVTAGLNTKFLKPVLCPGVVGIEVTIIGSKGNKMKIRGVMKDGNGTPLVQADGVWVRLGGGAKL
jgi:acyl-coenzyme A thioesterase PaaI-like protein